MIYKCKNCGNNVAKEAILCDNCGQENPAELVEQSLKATPLNPSENNKKSKKSILKWGCLFIAIFGIVVFWANKNNPIDDNWKELVQGLLQYNENDGIVKKGKDSKKMEIGTIFSWLENDSTMITKCRLERIKTNGNFRILFHGKYYACNPMITSNETSPILYDKDINENFKLPNGTLFFYIPKMNDDKIGVLLFHADKSAHIYINENRNMPLFKYNTSLRPFEIIDWIKSTFKYYIL